MSGTPSSRLGTNGVLKPVKKVEETASSIANARPLVPATEDPHSPIIPFTVIDAPSQRAYALAVYVAIFAWRLYDYTKVVKDEADSLLFFMKWTMIDGLYMYGLPGLRIPWLEWSGPTSLTLFVSHAILNWFLMFRIPIPIESWLVALTKILYDRELAVSERKVNPAEILRDSTLILGKHTIHILPEGSVVLNPDRRSYCLDLSRPSVKLPIRINQTNPVLIELSRVDLDNNSVETLTIPAKQAKSLQRKAEKHIAKHDTGSPRYLQYQVKQTGLYRLQRVVDKSGLEVHRTSSDALVVACPNASIKPTPPQKCRGELSNLMLKLQGTPPFKLKYSRTVNREDKGFSFQSIQPENFASLFKGSKGSHALVARDATDLSWARPHDVDVPLNESLNTLGHWIYSIEEVHDVCGNSANYSHRADDGERSRRSANDLEQAFTVNPRPRASLATSESPCIIKVARGKAARLPIRIDDSGQGISGAPYTISYRFTSSSELRSSGEHAIDAVVKELTTMGTADGPIIHEPGLYSLQAISSQHCTGEVLEPTSCVLENPPQPALAITSEDIHDTCAGNPIGLQVDLDLIGTPPFHVNYDVYSDKDRKVRTYSVPIDGLRHQLEFKPSEAGHYVYRFKSIKDSVYDLQILSDDKLVLQQDVKPPASARFTEYGFIKEACLDEVVNLNLNFQGEGPWNLEYEVVHGGKREKHTVKDIEEGSRDIVIGPLTDGGDFTVTLVSVQDKTRCKVFLSEEAKIHVRQQRPKAAFGRLESKRTVTALQGRTVSLPVRLTGQAPWVVSYRHSGNSAAVTTRKLLSSNDNIRVDHPGTYELVDVRDDSCPGIIDETAKTFKIEWVPRPSIQIAESATIETVDGKYTKKEVCEGDEDTIELSLTGTPPYYVKYQQRGIPTHGSASIRNKDFTAGLGVASVQMETDTAGLVEYRFTEVADNLYDHDSRKGQAPLILQQRVNAKPSAGFAVPGKAYKFCKEEGPGEEVISLTMVGTPPFYVEIGIKHQRHRQPEILRVPNIPTNRYDFRIPHRLLEHGSHTVSVRKVRDAKGCSRSYEPNSPHVLVHVADAPSISPLESRTDHCVGEWISYTLSGTPPFSVFYTFRDSERKASASTTSFRRIAETAGEFTITAIADQASGCKARTKITKVIHPMPSVKISKGRETSVDIHEGSTTEIVFDFSGTPPFEFTYTRSETKPARKGNGGGSGSGGSSGHSNRNAHAKNQPRILETKSDVSYDHVKIIRASEEGIYEAIAIKDHYCAFSRSRGVYSAGVAFGAIAGNDGNPRDGDAGGVQGRLAATITTSSSDDDDDGVRDGGRRQKVIQQ